MTPAQRLAQIRKQEVAEQARLHKEKSELKAALLAVDKRLMESIARMERAEAELVADRIPEDLARRFAASQYDSGDHASLVRRKLLYPGWRAPLTHLGEQVHTVLRERFGIEGGAS